MTTTKNTTERVACGYQEHQHTEGEPLPNDCGDGWVCICKNAPHLDGFVSANSEGVLVSPKIDGQWDEIHNVCLACGRIITREGFVVGTVQRLKDGLFPCKHDDLGRDGFCGECTRTIEKKDAPALEVGKTYTAEEIAQTFGIDETWIHEGDTPLRPAAPSTVAVASFVGAALEVATEDDSHPEDMYGIEISDVTQTERGETVRFPGDAEPRGTVRYKVALQDGRTYDVAITATLTTDAKKDHTVYERDRTNGGDWRQVLTTDSWDEAVERAQAIELDREVVIATANERGLHRVLDDGTVTYDRTAALS